MDYAQLVNLAGGRPDCPGLCSECGQRWDDLPEDHHHEHTNPTFDVLEGIRTQLEAEQA